MKAISKFLLWMIVLVALVLPPSAVAQDDTTTTLTWQLVATIEEDAYVRSMVIHESGIWVVGEVAEASPNIASRMWKSPDNLTWSTVDVSSVFGKNAHISALIAGDTGLLAAGSIFDEVNQTYEMVIWVSPDGQEWTLTPLDLQVSQPEDPWLQPYFDLRLASGVSGTILLARISNSLNWQKFEDAIEEKLPPGLDLEESDQNMVDPLGVDIFRGPLVVFQSSLVDLGMDSTAIKAYETSSTGGISSENHMWISPDRVNWTHLDTYPFAQESYIQSLIVTEDAFFALAPTWGGEGGLWVSSDGMNWNQMPNTSGFSELVYWDNHLIATESSSAGPLLWISEDGETWEQVPREAPQEGSLYGLTTGELGLASTGYADAGWGWAPLPPLPATILEKEGLRISLIEGTGGLTISDIATGEELLRSDVEANTRAPWGMSWGVLPTKEMLIDYEAESITILNPVNNHPLVSFTFDELETAYQSALEMAEHPGRYPQPNMAIWFSTDCEHWSVQSIKDTFKFDGYPQIVVVGEDKVFTVIWEETGKTLNVYAGTLYDS